LKGASKIGTGFLVIAVVVCLASGAWAQRTVLVDHDGRAISDNEFVDIRMANFLYPDATIVTTLPDGTVQMRVQKIPQEGMSAPEFNAVTADGKAVDTADLKGKVVVLNFWFIGCPACRAERPLLNDLKAKFAGRDDVVFLAVTYDKASAVRRYLEKQPFDYTQIADADDVLKKFVFAGYPKNIVISKTGQIVYWRSTVKAWNVFEAKIKEESAK